MQGFNMGRYVPPDQEGLTSGNKLHNKHALGARARNLHKTGSLTVRFEMPFAVWCTTCKPHETLIGQGVRFNADKKKIGNYHSTPVYSFRMRHPPCGGWIEIRTDPQNTAYVVAEGGRKRETGENAGEGEVVRGLAEMGERLRAGVGVDNRDPFERVQGKVDDRRAGEAEKGRVEELYWRRERDWADPYAVSRRVRAGFRAERKSLEKRARERSALAEKMSLGFEVVDESEGDRLRAGLVDFAPSSSSSSAGGAGGVRSKPLFDQRPVPSSPSSSSGAQSPRPGRSSTDKRSRSRTQLQSELTGNTRAAVDPFLATDDSEWRPEIKRRKPNNASRLAATSTATSPDAEQPTSASDTTDKIASGEKQAGPVALVDYASDSQ
ncbi:CWC16 protein [Aspergillus taichungensis]|uniref:CWC16 protein n=1 Tax=Aspergillus taichungensis TaxID=482145 RepID=A0A2J5HJI2_9EURO|nr:CWC16 protein [Aspergillus taichungensis]